MSEISNQALENACNAMDIIIEKALSKANFDKTVQAIVESCVDQSIGKYKVKYQGATFIATGDYGSVYTRGTNVYVLIPGNDMTREKKILGEVNKLSTGSVEESAGVVNKYVLIGTNIVTKADKFSLCSYQTETKTLYNDGGTNLLGIDTDAVTAYLKDSNATHIMFGANIDTDIPVEQWAGNGADGGGNYGIELRIAYKDKNDKDLVHIQPYILSSNDLTGNPYSLSDVDENIMYIDLDRENFLYVDSISIFDKDFPNQRSGEELDIHFVNFQLYGVRALSQAELEGFSLQLTAPRGSFFSNKQEIDLLIHAEIRDKGVLVKKKADYYWFIENAGITAQDKGYSRYGGLGWQCLNERKTLTVENVTLQDTYGPDEDTYSPIKKSQFNVRERVYKCVAVYDDNLILTREITFRNYSIDNNIYDLYLTSGEEGSDEESRKGTFAQYDINGRMVLNARIKQGTTNLSVEERKTNYTFKWVFINEEQRYNSLTIEEKHKNDPVSIYAPLNKILSFRTYKCAISKGEEYIGTATIILSRITQEENAQYSLTIVNGSQIYLYDEDGIAPTAEIKNPAMTIPELSFILHDNESGETFISTAEDFTLNATWRWKIPRKSTLLTLPKGVNKEEYEKEDDEEYYYASSQTLSYDIASVYDYNKIHNNIFLEMEYDNKHLLAQTIFTFVKQGEIGTNGTGTVCRIVTKHDVTNRWYTLNEDVIKSTKPFYVELWERNERILQLDDSTEDAKVIWSVQRNVYSKDIQDNSSIEITNNQFLVNSIFNSALANIVKVQLDYNNRTYYASVPLVAINGLVSGYIVDVVKGCQNIIYKADGTSPNYSRDPFEIAVYSGNRNNRITSGVTCTWTPVGGHYEPDDNGDWVWREIHNFKASQYSEDPKYLCHISPNSKFDGLTVTNALMCDVFVNESLIASLHIPIHMYLNRYGHAAINAWDGNSIQISDDGGIILAPQVGAGRKEKDNSFTGMLMGTVASSYKINDKGERVPVSDPEDGLFGYTHGQRSIFLDANTGKAEFGIAGKGQIIIDPGDGKDDNTYNAKIRSGNYYYNPLSKNKTEYTQKEKEEGREGRGLEIDLAEPAIRFGDGRFLADKNGLKIRGDFNCVFGGGYINLSKDTGIDLYYHEGDVFNDSEEYTFKLTHRKLQYLYKYNTQIEVPSIEFNMDGEVEDSTKTETVTLQKGLSYDTDSGLVINGDFSTIITPTSSLSSPGYVRINTEGIKMSYQTKEDDTTEQFLLQQNKLVMLKTTTTNENGKTKISRSGLSYANGKLRIYGHIEADTGTIGGWKIDKNSIYSYRILPNGNEERIMSLYSDGKIEGLGTGTTGGALSSASNTSRTVIGSGDVKIQSKGEKDTDDKWQDEGVIFTRDADNLRPHLGYTDFHNALTIAAKGPNHPLLFGAGGYLSNTGKTSIKANTTLVAAIIPKNKKYELQMKYNPETKKNEPEIDENTGLQIWKEVSSTSKASATEAHMLFPMTIGSDNTDENETNGEATSAAKKKYISPKSTRIYNKKIFTQDLFFPASVFDKEEGADFFKDEEEYKMFLDLPKNAQPSAKHISLSKSLKYIINKPKSAHYYSKRKIEQKDYDTKKRTFDASKLDTNAPEDWGHDVILEKWEINGHNYQRAFLITVQNRDDTTEKVTEIKNILTDETLSLEGF